MASNTTDVNNEQIPPNISYKPGVFRYHDLPVNQRRKYFDDRQKELNPCLKEAEMSSMCLTMAGENYHQCDAQVENYKTCKRFWNAVRLFATANHLTPNDGFPPLAQRPIWKKQLHIWIQTNKLTVPEEIKPLI